MPEKEAAPQGPNLVKSVTIGHAVESLETECNAESPDPFTGIDVDYALETIGLGKFQFIMMAFCGMGWFVDSVEVGGLSYIYVTLDSQWGTSPADWGLLSSAKSLFSVCGALTCGAAADHFGRRPTFLTALSITAVAGMACVAATDFRRLFWLRCLTNLGAGGLLPVSMSLLCEHLPPSCRDSCMILMQLFFIAGHVLAVILSMVFVAYGRWRLFLLLLALPTTLLLLVALTSVPESPVYLQQSGQKQAAGQALANISKRNRLSVRDFIGRKSRSKVGYGAEVLGQVSEPQHKTSDGAKVEGIYYLFSDRASGLRMVAFGLLWASMMTASDWISWVTEIGNDYGFKEESVEKFMLVLKLCGACAFVTAAFCARGGRGKHILRGALVASTLAALLASIMMAYESKVALVFAVTMLNFSYDMSWALVYATTASAFEPLCRTSAISVASSFARAAAAITPLVSGNLQMHSTSSVSFFWAMAWAVATSLSLCIDFTVPVATRCSTESPGKTSVSSINESRS